MLWLETEKIICILSPWSFCPTKYGTIAHMGTGILNIRVHSGKISDKEYELDTEGGWRWFYFGRGLQTSPFIHAASTQLHVAKTIGASAGDFLSRTAPYIIVATVQREGDSDSRGSLRTRTMNFITCVFKR